MLWNHLDYSLQCKVIDRIVDLLKDEEDELMQDGIIAAVHELEVWSNSPCEIVENIYEEEKDPFCENGWDLDK
jgi:hypothetical protein